VSAGMEPIPGDDSSAFASNAAIMAVGTAISRVTGFLRYAALAYVLGLTLRFGETNLPAPTTWPTPCPT